MIKCIVLYNFPPDQEEFEDHYFRVHLPLSSKLPGLRRREFAKFTDGPGAQPPAYYRIAELYFDDRSAMQQRLAPRRAGRRWPTGCRWLRAGSPSCGLKSTTRLETCTIDNRL